MSKTHGNFFSLPNDIFELELPPSAFQVYCYLRCCADRKTHQCYPSYSTISETLHMSINTVQKSIGILVDANLIRTENTTVITKGGEKRNGTLLYTILDVGPVLEEAHQRKMQELKQETARWERSKTAMV